MPSRPPEVQKIFNHLNAANPDYFTFRAFKRHPIKGLQTGDKIVWTMIPSELAISLPDDHLARIVREMLKEHADSELLVLAFPQERFPGVDDALTEEVRKWTIATIFRA